jgi:hypothetical protein
MGEILASASYDAHRYFIANSSIKLLPTHGSQRVDTKISHLKIRFSSMNVALLIT